MAVKIESAYLDSGFEWMRGNLHAHTSVSDGSLSPENVIAAYEKLGHQFLAISDHDNRTPLDALQRKTALTLIHANEVSARGPHLLTVNVASAIEPNPDRQVVIDAATAQGGFTVLNHPNWEPNYAHYPHDLMARLTGYAGIEIYNGVVEELPGSPIATDRWDRLLASGRRIWGFAHDDAHWPGNIGRAWNVVQVTGKGPQAVCDALKAGRFYASTGVEISRLVARSGMLFVYAPRAQCIRVLSDYGAVKCMVEDSELEYEVTGEEGTYIRVECYGRGTRCAWTQPFFITKPADA
jgi:hypothetical protein